MTDARTLLEVLAAFVFGAICLVGLAVWALATFGRDVGAGIADREQDQ